MIKLKTISVSGFDGAIQGMRYPMNSDNLSDSYYLCAYDDVGVARPYEFKIGEKDLELAKKLANAGSDHGKFLRMIHVQVSVTAPLYWVAEHDTYKVATTRNSASFMHKGASRPFTIDDFSVSDERVYEVLSPLEKKSYTLTYPYETDAYKIYQLENGRQYKVFRNGRIYSCAYSLVDSSGRTRSFQEREVTPSRTPAGYFEVHLGGRCGERWFVHRLVAHCWIENNNDFNTVNHINANKGDNSAENLEWCSRADNIKTAFNDGLYDNIGSLHSRYLRWVHGHTVLRPHEKEKAISEFKTLPADQIAEKYGLTKQQFYSMKNTRASEEHELFMLCYYWEETIKFLNCLREEYVESRDESVFQMLRQALPSGYNIRYMYDCSYANLRNMYHARKNHRLPEWRTFCEWIETLPYAKELIIGEP